MSETWLYVVDGVSFAALIAIAVAVTSIADSLRSMKIDVEAIRRKHG